MKGKSIFNKREVELIESLILQRCNADKSQQKNIRSKMRNLGFYGSDYGVKDMTIEKFHGLIKSGQIKVLDAGDEMMTGTWYVSSLTRPCTLLTTSIELTN